jgi:hypothetical protein
MIKIDEQIVIKRGQYLYVDEHKYLQRGSQTPEELKQKWEALKAKSSNTKLTFENWLIQSGKVYLRIRQ